MKVTLPQTIAVAAIILAAITWGRWWFAGKDLTRFSVCGSHFTDPSRTPVPIQVIPDSGGYDGQFFTRLAFSPFTSQRHAYGITIDSPAYRQQRILYPLLSWLLALGKATNVPWALVSINFLALLGITLVAGKISQDHGLSPFFGLLVMLSSGFILSFGRNLAEPLAGFFVITCLYELSRQHFLRASLLATAAVLTREPALITFAACGLTLLFHSLSTPAKNRHYDFFWLLLPLVAYLAWCWYLKSTWGVFPFSGNSGGNLQPWPLKDFFVELARLPFAENRMAGVVQFIYLLWFGQLAFYAINSFRERSPWLEKNPAIHLTMIRTAWTFWLIFACFLSTRIWEDDWSFVRVLAEWSLLGWLCIFTSGRKPPRTLIASTLLIAAGSALRLWLRP